MKKTLTAMALATSILPLSNTANAEQEANLNNLDNDNSKQVDLKEKTLITINKESLSATVLKDNVYLLNSEGKKVKTVEKGDKLQILKRISNEPFTKVNVNGEALYIANYAISNLNASNTSGTDFKLSASGKVINVASNDTLNVRDSDSTSGKILFTLKPNSSVTVSERTKNGWYKVDYYGNSGYVNGKYIQLIQPVVSESSFSAYGQALSNITVKDLPYSDGKSLFNIPLNAGVNIVSRVDNDWYKISYYGQTGYIKASSIKLLSSDNSSKPNFTVTPMGNVWAKIVTSSSIFGKKYPDNYSLDICKLVNDTGVYVTGKTSNGWYEVKYYNDTVYVPIANVKMIETPITTIGLDMIGIVYNVASNDVLNIRETPDADGKLITTLKNNAQVIVTGITSNDWYRLNINDKVGYANKKYIKQYIPTTTKYKVINSAINLRTSASWSGEAYQTISVGTTLNVVEISNGWASVYKDGKILYAPAKYLQSANSSTVVPTPPVTTPTPPVVEESKPNFTVSNLDMIGVVYNVASNDVLNIRETPDASSKLVTTLKNNVQVSVTGITSNDWYRVNVDSKVGYANKKYIKEYVPTTTKYKVINSAINLRNSPSWSGEAYQTVSVGTTLDVVEISNGWASVYKDKKIVYAPANYLQSADSSTVIPTPPVVEESKPNFTVSNLDMTGIVYNVASNDVLNIRETPDSSSKLVTTLKNNAQVSVTGITSNDWYRVNVDGKIGYANKKYIKEYVPTTTKYKVVNSAINLRKTASWTGEVYQVASVGTVLDVVEINGQWASVYKDKNIVYAPASYLVENSDSNTNTPAGNETYTKYNFTLSEYLSVQSKANPQYTTSDFEQYINPTKCNKFEFLKLDKFRNLDVTKLNTTLSSLNAGILIGKGQAFLDTAKKYNIDPLYFIAQSIHETGYGKSTLAKGVTISEIANTNKPITDSNGNITGYEMIKLPSPVTVYNLYGIGAYDNLPTMPNRALILGTTYAYNKGWTSVEKAIDGAGAFVSSNYINSTKYDQNTLYKIRYNPSNTYIWHQYATTPWYSRDIAKFMEKYSNLYIDNNFSFDKPLFNGMSEYSLLTFSSRISSLANFYLPAKEDITLIK